MLLALPRPEFFYVLGRAAAHGPRAGRLGALGVALAVCVHAVLMVLGCPPLAWLPFFPALRLAGTAYLAWCGLRALLPARGHSTSPKRAHDGEAIVLQALLCHLLDPRAELYSLFLLVQWARPEDSIPVFVLKAIFSGLLLAAALLGCFSLVSLAGARLGLALRLVLKRRTALTVDFDRAMGTLLIGLGLWLALQRS